MTFDVKADAFTGSTYGWMTHHELAVRCRRCKRLSILKADLSETALKTDFRDADTISKLEGDLEPRFRARNFLSVADLKGIADPPEHLPEDVNAAFVEGAKCMSIDCYNAAAAMFRLCLDLTTKPLLPTLDNAGVAQPTKEQRFKLGKRIDWLIEQRLIAPELSILAHSVREDSNDGVHDGSLDEKDAEDLLDFTRALLERQFTEPERLREAERRRAARRGEPSAGPVSKPAGVGRS